MRLKMVSHRDALAFVKERYGSAGLARLLERLSEADRSIAVHEAKLINNWVDVDAHVRLLQGVVSELAQGDESVLLELGEWIATAQLRGVYRVFLLVVSPEFMLKRSSVIFGTLYDGGNMDVVSLGPGKFECTFNGFTKKQRLIELSIMGWFAGASKLSRATDGRLEMTQSLAQGEGHFRLLFTYKV